MRPTTRPRSAGSPAGWASSRPGSPIWSSQIIDLSRLQADNPLATPEVVDIDEVLNDAVDR